jgi:hypothetical protein
MNYLRPAHRIAPVMAAALVLLLTCGFAAAQETGAKPQDKLAAKEKSLAEQFDRLELLAGRLAELSKATQPRRAELLQQLVARSREKDLPGRFQEVVAALEKDNLNDATKGQSTLHADLQAMLELLLQEDRDRQLESERQRIAKYLADLNKIIRQQRGIRARTEGGDSEQQLGEDQQRAADNTGELGDKIESTEVTPEKSSAAEESESGDSSKPGEKLPKEKGEPQDADPSKGDPSKQDGEQQSPSDSQPQESKPNDSKPSESQPGESQGQSQPNESEPSESQGQPSEQGQSQPSPSQGQPSQSQGGQPSPSQSEKQQADEQSPSERAVEKLRQAQERMKQAEEKLKEAERNEAVEQQEQALRELEQAKAELEKILRQIREEEMERMLVLLEARLRKMLELQNEVYDETIKLSESTGHVPEHELEIACASLGRKEDQIVGEADRALVLMQEDGSSVAFPEAVQQAREDMRTVADRLRGVKTDKVTQALEEDIIATLEETLAALQQALKELREKKASQQQSQSGEPGEQPLVDQLAELRMIRALQARVNRRTEFYDGLIEGDQTREAELLDALHELAQRQERIFEATRDLHQGTNR